MFARIPIFKLNNLFQVASDGAHRLLSKIVGDFYEWQSKAHGRFDYVDKHVIK